MSQVSPGRAFAGNFLGSAPRWYKLAIIAFLAIYPVLFAFDPYAVERGFLGSAL